MSNERKIFTQLNETKKLNERVNLRSMDRMVKEHNKDYWWDKIINATYSDDIGALFTRQHKNQMEEEMEELVSRAFEQISDEDIAQLRYEPSEIMRSYHKKLQMAYNEAITELRERLDKSAKFNIR